MSQDEAPKACPQCELNVLTWAIEQAKPYVQAEGEDRWGALGVVTTLKIRLKAVMAKLRRSR